MKCVSYLRTSSLANVGGDKDSRSRQENLIEEYADRNDFRIVESAYDPGRSGADPIHDRTGFDLLLNYCEENKVDTILVETSGRYARDKDVAVRGFYLMQDYGIKSLIDCEADLDLQRLWFSDKPYEALLPFLKMILSAEEKQEIVRRLKSGREKKKAETGKCEGRKSLVQRHGKEIIDLATEARSEGKSYQAIADLLEARGIKTENNTPLTKGTVWNLLNIKTLK